VPKVLCYFSMISDWYLAKCECLGSAKASLKLKRVIRDNRAKTGVMIKYKSSIIIVNL
jgi:hypothetical protein